jgi:hypothetical protein
VVTDKLEAAEHLANGEEADALSGKDAGGGQLGPADAADLFHGGGGIDGAEGLREGSGLLNGFPQVLVVGLEGADRPVGVTFVSLKPVRGWLQEGTLRYVHLLALED